MAIKQSKNRLNLATTASDYTAAKLDLADFELLTIDLPHLALISTLPLYHRDPFDRLLIAQAIDEDIPILSRDRAFDAYSVQRFWE